MGAQLFHTGIAAHTQARPLREVREVHVALEAGVGAQDVDVQRIAEVRLEAVQRQALRIDRALRRQRRQAHLAAPRQAARLGPAAARPAGQAGAQVDGDGRLAVQVDLLGVDLQLRQLGLHRAGHGGIAPAHGAAGQRQFVHQHFPREVGGRAAARFRLGRLGRLGASGLAQPGLVHQGLVRAALHRHARRLHAQLAHGDGARAQIDQHLAQVDLGDAGQRAASVNAARRRSLGLGGCRAGGGGRGFGQHQLAQRQLLGGDLQLGRQVARLRRRPLQAHVGVQLARQARHQVRRQVRRGQPQRQVGDAGVDLGTALGRRALEFDGGHGLARGRGRCLRRGRGFRRLVSARPGLARRAGGARWRRIGNRRRQPVGADQRSRTAESERLRERQADGGGRQLEFVQAHRGGRHTVGGRGVVGEVQRAAVHGQLVDGHLPRGCRGRRRRTAGARGGRLRRCRAKSGFSACCTCADSS